MAEESETATSSSHTQPSSSTSAADANLKPPQFPMMYPAALVWDNQEQMNNRGRAGIYAIPVLPYGGISTDTLIPLTYNIPTSRPNTEGGAVNTEHAQAGQQQQNQQQQQQPARQRQVVVRRFQIAFQLDLLLILKLAAVIFVFNQDGSRLRLIVLVFFASLIYLYQTGALTPLLRWLQQSMQRAAAPPRPPRPAVRADNDLAAAGQGNENAALAEGQAGAENENQPLNDGNRAAENQNEAEPGVNGGNQWWGIVKEIQMIVFGFITSLLPGFHNID